MNPIPPIGIDLGETSMVAAVYRNGHVEVIPNDVGKTSTPLKVYYGLNSSNVYIGESIPTCCEPKNTIIDLKKIIGKKYDDSYVQVFKTQQQSNYFKIMRGCENSVKIVSLHNNEKVIISIEQAYSELIKYLRRCASKYLDGNVTEAVISVPALFNSDQRQATITAAKLAGLTVLSLITDPVANAIYYNRMSLKTEENILIFNFEQKALNISVVEAKDNGFRVKMVEENNFLGGQHFHPIVFLHRGVLDMAKQCVAKAGLSPTDITQVLFLGDTRRILQVREILCTHFKGIDLGMNIDPKDTTAFGAAIQASILNEKGVLLEIFNVSKSKDSSQQLNLPEPSLPSEISLRDIFKKFTLVSQGGNHDSLMNRTLTKNSLQKLNLPQSSQSTFKEEEEVEIFSRYKWKVRKICNSILSDLNKIADNFEKLFVQEKCIQLKDVLGRLDWKQIEVLRTDYRKFKSRVQHIVEDYSVNVRLSDDSDIFNIVLLEAGDLDQVDQ